ncbi:hypothetical protein [Kocuria sp. KH4]
MAPSHRLIASCPSGRVFVRCGAQPPAAVATWFRTDDQDIGMDIRIPGTSAVELRPRSPTHWVATSSPPASTPG